MYLCCGRVENIDQYPKMAAFSHYGLRLCDMESIHNIHPKHSYVPGAFQGQIECIGYSGEFYYSSGNSVFLPG